MTKLTYTTDEILAEHSYAQPHVEAGYTLHGGFDAQGHYISPRTLHRWPAIRAWENALRARGQDVVDTSQQLMTKGSYPSVAQQSFLLDLGLGQTLWDSLSVTGVVEARGKVLATAEAPDFQSIVKEDISQTATAHLNKGLFRAHGLDEGGDGVKGGHDAMWFAVRDMLFGKHAYPHTEVPASLGRPDTGRLMPQIPPEYERCILMLMNVLMIEVRAEHFFNFCTTVMRDPRNFTDRRAVAMHAADLVDRIRQDEAPHVGYLTVVVSELRSFTFRTVDGKDVKGSTFIDPVWRGMVQWHAATNVDYDRAEKRKEFQQMFDKRGNGAELMHQFDNLGQKEAA
ncbi:MAG: hypothetical protein JSR81_12165 [Proteobacteria bacterium]|nr:hypothetical protein [Pseudomonadota bacterium]